MLLKIAAAFSIFMLTSSALDTKPAPEDSSGWKKLAKQDGFDLGERIAYTAHSNYLDALVPLKTYEETKDMTALEKAVIHLNAAAIRRHPGALKVLFGLMSDENIPYEFNIVRIPEGLNFRSLPFMTASEVLALPKTEQLEIVRRSEISEILKSPELTALFFELTADFYPDIVREYSEIFVTALECKKSQQFLNKDMQPQVNVDIFRNLSNLAMNSKDPFKLKVAQFCLAFGSIISELNEFPIFKTVESYFLEVIGALISILPTVTPDEDHLFWTDITDPAVDFIGDVIDENYMSAGFLYRLVYSYETWANIHKKDDPSDEIDVNDEDIPPTRWTPAEESAFNTKIQIAQYFTLLGWDLHRQYPNISCSTHFTPSIYGFHRGNTLDQPDAPNIYDIPNTTLKEQRNFVLRILYQTYQTAKVAPIGFNYLLLAAFNLKGLYEYLWNNGTPPSEITKMQQFCVKYLHAPSLEVFAKNMMTELAFYADRIISNSTLPDEDKGDILGNIAGIFNRQKMFTEAERYYMASFNLDADSANIYGLYECFKRGEKLDQLHEILAQETNLEEILPDYYPEFMVFYETHLAWLEKREQD